MWNDFVFNAPCDCFEEQFIPDEINGAKLPDEYVEFMKKHDGGEGDTSESTLILFPIQQRRTTLTAAAISYIDHGGSRLCSKDQ